MIGQKTGDFNALKESLHSCCYGKCLINHLDLIIWTCGLPNFHASRLHNFIWSFIWTLEWGHLSSLGCKWLFWTANSIVLGRWRQVAQGFKVILGYIGNVCTACMRPCFTPNLIFFFFPESPLLAEPVPPLLANWPAIPSLKVNVLFTIKTLTLQGPVYIS